MSKADSVNAELQRIAKEHDGRLLPEDVVEAARPKNSVLHSRFCWDDTEAANQFRLWQARQLIRVTVQVIGKDDNLEPVRTFVSLTTDRYAKEERGGYRTIAAVLNNAEYTEQLLEDALDEMKTFRKKYARLKQLSEVFAAMDRAERKVLAATA